MKKAFRTKATAIALAAITAISLTACSSAKKEEVKTSGVVIEKASVDTISKASTKYYYEKSALQGKDLVDAVNARSGSFTYATTNEDGSPNLAVFGFGMIDEKYAMAGITASQSLENIKRNKIAVVSFYQYNPKAEDKLERNKGARLIIKLIEDKAKIDELKAKTQGKSNESTIFFEIVQTKPLG